jgi:hypothetical protein
MRFIIAAVLIAASTIPIGCQSKEARDREQLERDQKQMMEKLLVIEAEREARDGGAPAPQAPVDAGTR